MNVMTLGFQDNVLLHRLLLARELGRGHLLPHIHRVRRRLVLGLQSSSVAKLDQEGIFNLAFNQRGSLLVACCERNSMLFIDPTTRRTAITVEAAHRNCVNTARFIDEHLLASCSDDNTVALWDVRRLKGGPHRVLRGHKSWVKNVECKDKMLVTSGFDSLIHTWDLSNEDVNLKPKLALKMEGLMRMRLAGCDKSTMVVASRSGYLLIVHNLNLSHLGSDLRGFDPGLFRMTQLTGRPTHRFNHDLDAFLWDRNRVELVTDFPQGDEAELVASLDVEPTQGLVAVSRNTCTDEESEWTCVHDISDRDVFFDPNEEDYGEDLNAEHNWLARRRRKAVRRQEELDIDDNSSVRNNLVDRDSVAREAITFAWRQNAMDLSVLETNDMPWWCKNRPRLTHFIEETNTSMGYIKELAFSPDGRLIASPFANGLRILAFNNSMDGISDCELPREAKQLVEVTTLVGNHDRTVVSTAFSPTQHTLVTGCLGGRLTWYEPRL